MCGIVGILSTGRPAPNSRVLLDAMRDALRHRGPDDAGSWWGEDGRVGLAQRRLSIIDLSPTGHQPMATADGRLTIVFNGEIYNYAALRQELVARGHRFRGTSDTEVVLTLWQEHGAAALDLCNGMFALAVYDRTERTVTLARDRVGEKPLFYWHAPGRVFFASELKGLLAHPDVPRTLDVNGLDEYLTYGYVMAPRTMLRDVHKLRPGHLAVFDLATGAFADQPYWTLTDEVPSQDGDENSLCDRLEALMLESVRLRLTAADVPVGILLSGGLDSSLVTALAARASPSPVRTFSVTFPGHGSHDESAHARLVAAHVGARHTELPLEPATVDILPQLARIYDEPIADSSMVPTYLVSRLIRSEATVALGGDGGDELFAGYPHYQWLAWQQTLRRLLPAPVRAGVASLAARMPLGARARNHLIGLSGDASWAAAHVNVYFDHATRARLLNPGLAARRTGPTGPEQRKASLAGWGSMLQRGTRVDFLTYLPDDLLVKVDRASMAASLEVRCPWLDHNVIDFAFSEVPDRFKAQGGRRKILLQTLAKRLLPARFDATRKQGFSLPLNDWFAGSWGVFLRDVLLSADVARFDRKVVEELLAGQEKGRANMQRLYALAFFELWRHEYRISA